MFMFCCPCFRPDPAQQLWDLANAQIPQGPGAGKSIGWDNDVNYRKYPAGWEKRFDSLNTYVASPVQLNGETYEIVFREQRHMYGVNYSVSLFKDKKILVETITSNSCSDNIYSSDESKMGLFDAAIRTTLHLPPQSVFKFVHRLPYGLTLL